MLKLIQLSTLLLWSIHSFGNDVYPPKPNPHRYVNDLAGILSKQQENELEKIIADFYLETSNQIAVVTVKSLHGIPASEYATELGHRWGVGTQGKDNGIVLLVKPKYGYEKGHVFIAVGYGLEHVVTDARAKRIVEQQLIPNFKKNNYYKGIDLAVIKLVDLTTGSYTFRMEDLAYSRTGTNIRIGLLILLILLPVLYIFFLHQVNVPKKFRASFISSGYSVNDILHQISLVEKELGEKCHGARSIISQHKRLGEKRVLKMAHLIDNKLFCKRLGEQNRKKVFWSYSDIFLKVICGILIFELAFFANYFVTTINWISIFFSLPIGALLIYWYLSMLYSIVEITQAANRSNHKTVAGVSLAYFALGALFKRNIKRTFDTKTGRYYYKPVVLYSSVSYSSGGWGSSGFGGGFSSGGGFGGGGFGGGGAGGSW